MYNCPVRWYRHFVCRRSVDEMSVDELSWNHCKQTPMYGFSGVCFQITTMRKLGIQPVLEWESLNQSFPLIFPTLLTASAAVHLAINGRSTD